MPSSMFGGTEPALEVNVEQQEQRRLLAPTGTEEHPSLQALHARLKEAQAEPWKHSFTTLLRAISATHDTLPGVGEAPRPQAEAFRLGQLASLIFAPREIGELTWQNQRPLIRLLGLGMLGPNGPLPMHFTEIIRERSESKRDPTLARFLDLFHHRALSHLYRAWAISQAAAGLDRPSEERFSNYIARLSGDEVGELADTPLPRHARWASSAHRVRQSRDPAGLSATLSNYFGVKVEVLEFQRHWIAIESQDTCRLGTLQPSSLLGAGALVGEVVPDCQHKFTLRIGPLKLRQYLRFTPQGHESGTDLRTLVEWVRAFIGFEYIWEVELLIAADEAPACQMGGNERLGWSSWMGHSDGKAIMGMVFQPENYLHERAT